MLMLLPYECVISYPFYNTYSAFQVGRAGFVVQLLVTS
ncbi:hypothetical protein MC7420_1328 [Coleofasciculus chthonoplastes PCC 7420]|uniref:Uncharacterized protein n=1 Tax=Coleofasciculus chthonoplastes PCC 7420 TaxID=118168 RepID=B4VR74_9CYAN|nr:hypothetical protein MC7420_1328 [Coleofasciculus chthonoplastes PCC 7420]